MNTTTKQIIAQNSPISLNSIYDKMRDRLKMPKIVDGVVYKCAEVAETLMMEAVLKKERQIVYLDKPEPFVTLSANSCGRSVCPSCKRNNIYTSFKFCPRCGIEILWVS